MQKTLYLLGLLLLFMGCKHSSNLPKRAELTTVSKITLKFDGEKDIPVSWDVFVEKDTTFLLHTFYDKEEMHSPKLRLYDLNRQNLVYEANLPDTYQGKEPSSAIRVVDKNHIFICLSVGAAPSFSEDSTLLLVNYKGEVLKVFENRKMNTPYEGMDYEEMARKHCMAFDRSARISTDFPQWLFVPFRRPTLGYDSAAIQFPLPMVAAWNLASDTIVYFKDYTYPTSVLANSWGQEVCVPRITLSLEGKALIQTGYTPTIWEWDASTNQSITHRIQQPIIVDSIKPFPIRNGMPEYGDFYNKETGGYAHLSTQATNKQYIWWVALPKDYYGVQIANGYCHTGFIVLDEHFRTLGEGTTETPIFYTMPKPIGKNFITADVEANINSFGQGGDSAGLHFLLFNVEINAKQNAIPKPKEKLTAKEIRYFQKYFPQVLEKEKSVVVLTPINAFCQKCLNRVEDELTNKNSAENYPNTFLLYLSEDGQKYGNPYLSADTPPANILADLNAKYVKYLPKPNAPTVYFLRNGKIVHQQAITVSNETLTLQEIDSFIHPPQ